METQQSTKPSTMLKGEPHGKFQSKIIKHKTSLLNLAGGREIRTGFVAESPHSKAG